MQQKITVCISTNRDSSQNLKTSLPALLQQKHTLWSLRILDNSTENFCWDDPANTKAILAFGDYSALPEQKSKGEHYQKILNTNKSDFILFMEDNVVLEKRDDVGKMMQLLLADKDAAIVKHSNSFFLARPEYLRRVSGFDFKYTHGKNIVQDLIERLKLANFHIIETSVHAKHLPHNKIEQEEAADKQRLETKKNDVRGLFGKQILYIDGGMGDHICALPLISQFENPVICAKYPHVFSNIKTAQFVDWNDPLFGGLGFNMYEFGSYQESMSLCEAFCFSYGRTHDDRKLQYKFEPIPFYNNNPKFVVIAPYASRINDTPSNKNWVDIRWVEITYFLQGLGYDVIQAGTFSEPQIPNVNARFHEHSTEELASIITACSFWISVDSYFHHLASAVGKPGICLSPTNNEHAFHRNNIYIVKKPDNIALNNRWLIDLQQPERKKCMELITTSDVRQVIVKITDTKILPLSEELQSIQNSAMQIPSEITRLQKKVLEDAPEIIVEIGTSVGGTIGRWLQIPTAKTVISIDLVGGIHGGTDTNTHNYLVHHCEQYAIANGKQFFSIEGDSKRPEIITQLRNILHDRKIDFLFIDGDHTFHGVAQDFINYTPLVKDNGIVAFHDVINSEYHHLQGAFVDEFWSELKTYAPHEEFINIEEGKQYWPETANYGGFGGIGVIRTSKTITQKYTHRFNTLANKNISVVIGCYDGLEHTRNCIQSILDSQPSNSCTLQEIIIVNNGSTDGTTEYLDSITDPKVKVVHYPEPLGYAKAFNEGIKLASAAHILLCNSDVVLFSNWMDRMIAVIVEQQIHMTAPVVQNSTHPMLVFSAVLVKREVFEKVGLLDESFEVGYCEDDEFSRRVLNAGFTWGPCANISHIDENSNAHVDFPIQHIGMVTTRKLKNVHEIIQKNKDKLSKLQEHNNICYALVADDGTSIAAKISELSKDTEAMVLVLKGQNFNIYDKVEKSLLYQPNVHVVELLENSFSMERAQEVAEIFFHQDRDCIFYISEHPISTDEMSFSWLCNWTDYASMGILSQKIMERTHCERDAKNMENIGAVSTNNKLILDLLERKTKNRLGVMFSYPDSHEALNNFKYKITYTGADTTGGIPNFAENCNKSNALFTPSTLSRSYMKELGVTKPVFTFPHGVDTELFQFRPRFYSHGEFTFLYVGECSDRKGIFQLLEGFKKLSKTRNIRLILKSNKEMEWYNQQELHKAIDGHKNIVLIQTNTGQEEVEQLMRMANCYIYCSRSDTWGMSVLEALATGLPVISNTNLGFRDCISEDMIIPLKSKMVDVTGHAWMKGQWSETDVNDLIEKMEYVIDHYEEATVNAERASQHVHKNCNWDVVVNNWKKNTLSKIHESNVLTNKYKPRLTVIVSSYERPEYLKIALESLRERKNSEPGILLDIHVFDQSSPLIQSKVITLSQEYPWAQFHFLSCNLGQRGLLNHIYETGILDGSEYIMLTDHDNRFHRPLLTYCELLRLYPECFIATGYVSPEHPLESLLITEEFGTILKKNLCRAGHMVFRGKQLKAMLPLPLDSQFGQPNNSSWNIGLDFEITHWNTLSPAKLGYKAFTFCVPNGAEHIGFSSTWRNTDKEAITSIELRPEKLHVINRSFGKQHIAEIHKLNNY